MIIHDGHRERMKNRFLEHGLEGFDDHHVLELLLFYALPRADVNPLAHLLLDRFGSLSAVFDAPLEELVTVPGIAKNTALFIKLLPQVSRRYHLSRTRTAEVLDTSRKAGEYLTPYFYAQREELVYMLCLDARCRVLTCKLLFQGSVNAAGVSVRKLVETALLFNSTSIILAHNHPSGLTAPSPEDLETTRRIHTALSAVDIQLTDHIIVADGDFLSLADTGFF